MRVDTHARRKVDADFGWGWFLWEMRAQGGETGTFDEEGI